ncbi:MAG: DNA-deoxyinosine glycosylase [Reinekea sp.]
MSAIESFAAVSGERPRILILGSIPGVASLNAVQYYAHPRNAFWSIMAAYFGFSASLGYAERLMQLQKNGVALWDVLQRCERPGSLDSAIKQETIEVNPIDQLVTECPSLKGILLNGGKAGKEFNKAFPELAAHPDIKVRIMPSTSPAYAAMPMAEKTKRWHQELDSLLT